MHNGQVDRKIVLDTLIKHETLTIDDLNKPENLGVCPDPVHLQLLLEELAGSGYLENLPCVLPVTYTITKKGIDEGVRLKTTSIGNSH
jgi:hypothetical protein